MKNASLQDKNFKSNSSKLYYLIARTLFEIISHVFILVRFHQIYIHNTNIRHLQEAGYSEAKECRNSSILWILVI